MARISVDLDPVEYASLREISDSMAASAQVTRVPHTAVFRALLAEAASDAALRDRAAQRVQTERH
jgi:hypothetical protein